MADREMNKTGGTAPESAGDNCVPRLDSAVARTAERAIDVTERYTHLKLDLLPCKLKRWMDWMYSTPNILRASCTRTVPSPRQR